MWKYNDKIFEYFFYYESIIVIRSMEKNRPVNNHGHTHLCVDVTDIEVEYKRLLKNGVPVYVPPQEIGKQVKTTYGRDCDGNVFESQEIIDPEHPNKGFND